MTTISLHLESHHYETAVIDVVRRRTDDTLTYDFDDDPLGVYGQIVVRGRDGRPDKLALGTEESPLRVCDWAYTGSIAAGVSPMTLVGEGVDFRTRDAVRSLLAAVTVDAESALTPTP